MKDKHTMHGPTEDTVRSFQSMLEGQLIGREDDGYVEACAIYNAMIDKSPAMVARCSNTEDVRLAINFAREYSIPLAVRGGGHSVAGKSLVDDGLVIDLSGMKQSHVDPGNRTVRVQGGATWYDVDYATHEHGLAVPGGLISSTGVGGLTLGGGIAWLMRKYGMSCDNLLRAEVVTADGTIVNASQDENEELFWALRGGGGNFGVVNEFEFRLHPVHTVLGGMIVHPYERAKEALQFYREFTSSAPDEVTVAASAMITPEGDKVVAFVVCYAGDPEKGNDVIKPLLEWGPPVMTDVKPLPYPQMQQLLDEAFPPGLQNYWRSSVLATLPDQGIDTIISYFDNVESPLTSILIEHFGGAMGRVPRDATAFPHRDASYNMVILARWTEPGDEARHISWARELDRNMQPYATGGVYVNYLSDEGREPVKSAYGSDTYTRLAAIKSRWDPDNLFRVNQNIQPVH